MTTDDRTAPPTVRIPERVLTTSEARALKASPYELGGIMVGWWEGNATAVVQDVLPVPDRRAGRTHYERKHSHAQEVLDEYRRKCDDPRVGYIGEWHSHPAPQPPSSIDRGALSALVRKAHTPAALVVLSLTPEGDVVKHALIGRPLRRGRTEIVLAVVERIPS